MRKATYTMLTPAEVATRLRIKLRDLERLWREDIGPQRTFVCNETFVTEASLAAWIKDNTEAQKGEVHVNALASGD